MDVHGMKTRPRRNQYRLVSCQGDAAVCGRDGEQACPSSEAWVDQHLVVAPIEERDGSG